MLCFIQLRDLFTVHRTACQTHQLLGCACASGSSNRQSSVARDSSAEVDAVDEDGENKEDEDEDEENFAVGFVRASLYKPSKVSEEVIDIISVYQEYKLLTTWFRSIEQGCSKDCSKRP